MKKQITLLLLLFSTILYAQKLTVVVSNPSNSIRVNETVEIPWKKVISTLNTTSKDHLVVIDSKGKEYPSQIIYEGNKEPQKLIFQVSMDSQKSITLKIKKGSPQKYETKTYGRFVPERKDDYAWENDRVAFRIYGPALIKSDGPSNGIDVWCKRTDKMIVDLRYEKELSGKGTYHTDWGDGLDMYKVGRTLGAGAMAPFTNDSLWLASNFATQETLDNGPIRTTFRLIYSPFDVNGTSVSETRTISLDAGSQLNKIVEQYNNVTASMPVAAGIVKREKGDSIAIDLNKKYAIYFEPKSKKDGVIYLAIVSSKAWENIKPTQNHLLAITKYLPDSRLEYYTGYGWSKWGFPTPTSWVEYIKRYTQKLQNPLIVTIKQ